MKSNERILGAMEDWHYCESKFSADSGKLVFLAKAAIAHQIGENPVIHPDGSIMQPHNVLILWLRIPMVISWLNEKF